MGATIQQLRLMGAQKLQRFASPRQMTSGADGMQAFSETQRREKVSSELAPPRLWSGMYKPWAPSLLGSAYFFARVLVQPRPPWFPLPGPRARLTDLKPQALTFRSLGQKYYQPAQTYKQHVPLIPAAYCAQAPQVKEKNAACYQPSWATDSDKPRSRYVTSLIKHQSA